MRPKEISAATYPVVFPRPAYPIDDERQRGMFSTATTRFPICALAERTLGSGWMFGWCGLHSCERVRQPGQRCSGGALATARRAAARAAPAPGQLGGPRPSPAVAGDADASATRAVWPYAAASSASMMVSRRKDARAPPSRTGPDLPTRRHTVPGRRCSHDA